MTFPEADNTSLPSGSRGWPRRSLLAAGLALAAAPVLAGAKEAARPLFAEVWKDPNCGCCKDWVAHLEQSGFKVKVNDVGNTAMRARLGVPVAYGSCHTALIGGYAVEGHVPAADIKRLLKEKPQALGLSVPGMPVGSPGMDGAAYGHRQDAFKVLLLSRDGGVSVWQEYPGAKA